MSIKPVPLCLPPYTSINKLNFTSLALLLQKLPYLAMLFILQLTHTAYIVGQLENK